MGREAITHANVGRESGEVKALLESTELILRGAIKRRFAKSAITDVRVTDKGLAFVCAGEGTTLALGVATATLWAKALAKEPPSLKAKLGLTDGVLALVLGQWNDDALSTALAGARTDDPAAAAMVIACVSCADDLAMARQVTTGRPIWTLYPKGGATPFGDAAIRNDMRAHGFRDTKSCAVSTLLTATRYNPVASPQ
ncbi:hypothetical protein GE253_22220 [Niveispirillum sp. SYP-B3756]|uniref:hypothetical protein n=1 Tax=Niveispirillum sp. SYP-B3756 TaxID=2662178 RepID=UPI00129209A7|nr:hypothetical protein [Niveispirillum sp. SYP-B3756]MQP68037.1 hypothetical protein [Niveispirillum sp. SYP-B3756]